MKKVRAAVIGVGYLGRFHAQKYAQLEESELVAVVDARQEACAAVATEVGTKALADYRSLLGQPGVTVELVLAGTGAIGLEQLAGCKCAGADRGRGLRRG